ncbi:hypothetical protein PPERSA_07928 [Pseudocohnilembus persalinus]|uniref:Uncharacterized protein n=1 Tax=Pseudocohnilembus persalinus TaxID=266149 RepID=A0A0V0QB42_PSEPJ|nr:hypothetical protein PPERSA_07928 [Pseudocohnilembus persalinus]|eukprot:KRW99443.1 hypothetical protein PPERSA_07928 [Pseudocohnilembus persalinus]
MGCQVSKQNKITNVTRSSMKSSTTKDQNIQKINKKYKCQEFCSDESLNQSPNTKNGSQVKQCNQTIKFRNINQAQNENFENIMNEQSKQQQLKFNRNENNLKKKNQTTLCQTTTKKQDSQLIKQGSFNLQNFKEQPVIKETLEQQQILVLKNLESHENQNKAESKDKKENEQTNQNQQKSLQQQKFVNLTQINISKTQKETTNIKKQLKKISKLIPKYTIQEQYFIERQQVIQQKQSAVPVLNEDTDESFLMQKRNIHIQGIMIKKLQQQAKQNNQFKESDKLDNIDKKIKQIYHII